MKKFYHNALRQIKNEKRKAYISLKRRYDESYKVLKSYLKDNVSLTITKTGGYLTSYNVNFLEKYEKIVKSLLHEFPDSFLEERLSARFEDRISILKESEKYSPKREESKLTQEEIQKLEEMLNDLESFNSRVLNYLKDLSSQEEKYRKMYDELRRKT